MYKIIHDDKVIDVIDQPMFVRFLENDYIAMTDKTSAQGIVGSDKKTIYSLDATINKKVLVVTLQTLTDIKEFERLRSLLSSGQEVSADESALAKAKQLKISQLSNLCKNKIIAGFSIELTDGEVCDFKFTLEDQLNLMLIENQINLGYDSFIYHATNQPCKFFTREDMIKIVNTFKQYKLYHTTYFNIAKQYINSLVDINKVNSFTYGMDVSEMTDDVILKQILKNGGNII
jgi:hypothetical protein